MPVRLSSLKVDLELEAVGEWIDSPAFENVRWHLRSLNCPEYQTARAELLKKLRSKFGTQPVPQDALSAEFGRLYAKRLLLGWEGLDVPYSRETAVEVLGDPAYREVVSDIEMCAARVARLNVEIVEEIAKNSAPPSDTK